MPSPIMGVWELVSDSDKALWLFTEDYFSYISNRQESRLGHAGAYQIEGNHLQLTRILSTPTNSVTELTMEFQRDGDLLTVRLLTDGNALPVGHRDTYRRIGE